MGAPCILSGLLSRNAATGPVDWIGLRPARLQTLWRKLVIFGSISRRFAAPGCASAARLCS